MVAHGDVIALDGELAVAASNQVTKAIREPRAWGEAKWIRGVAGAADGHHEVRALGELELQVAAEAGSLVGVAASSGLEFETDVQLASLQNLEVLAELELAGVAHLGPAPRDLEATSELEWTSDGRLSETLGLDASGSLVMAGSAALTTWQAPSMAGRRAASRTRLGRAR